jgi:hypothetical protein
MAQKMTFGFGTPEAPKLAKFDGRQKVPMGMKFDTWWSYSVF